MINGEITKVRRLTPGVNQFWEVTIEPDGFKTVSMTARTTALCTNANAICTADGRPLVRNSTLEVRPYGPSFTVADVETTEGSDFSFHFSAILSYALSYGINVPYEIQARTASSGPPNSGHDFKGFYGILNFPPGSLTARTASIIVYDDTEIEGREALHFKMGGAQQHFQPQGEQLIVMEPVDATGWINDNDPTPPPATPFEASYFTAEYRNMPATHDGALPFTFELHFSEEVPGLSYRTVARNRVGENPTGLLNVTGGTINKASRTTPGSNQGWRVTVTPTGTSAVRVWLLPSPACTVAGAVCNSAGAPLAHGISATVAMGTPITLSIADATVEEGPDAKLDFVVSLSRAADHAVTGKYVASNGTAHGNVDYELTLGSFTIAVGETQTTVSVAVLDDSHDEGSETVIMTLYDVRGLTASQIADASAVGTITNSDPMPGAWLARFGRTVADQVLATVEGRLAAPLKAGTTVSIAGRSVSDIAEAEPLDWTAEDARSQTLAGRDVLAGTAFALTGGEAGSGAGAFWGQGAVSSFEGSDDDVALEGDVASLMLGMDWSVGTWTAGLLVSHSFGEGDYIGVEGIGTTESSLTGLYPYGRFTLNNRLALWIVGGYGEGEFTLTPLLDTAMTADMSLMMGAVGVRGVAVAAPDTGGFELAVKSDAMAVRTSTESTAGLAEAEADVTRLRLGIEASWRGMGGGLTPRLELGVRQDGGDAETGFGLDAGAGLAWSDPSIGISGAVSARGILSHEADGFNAHGFAGSLAMESPGFGGGARAVAYVAPDTRRASHGRGGCHVLARAASGGTGRLVQARS